MKIRVLLISFFLFFLPISQTMAVTVTGLYEATVPVADQSASSQAKGIRAALLQVMVKLTGKRNAAGIYGVSNLLDNANQYLQQYEFRSVNDVETNETLHRLWVRFDSNAIQNEVRQYSIPIWSQERPSTLIWLVINDDLGQRFANLDRASRYLQILNEQASARGIRFVTPLLDHQDSNNLKVDDVVGTNTETIKQASSRYVADAVLTVVVNQAGLDIWEAEWLSIIQERDQRWSTSGTNASEVISEGVDAMADTLASIYSQDVGYANESNFDIIVSGIHNFNSYAKTLRYLESLNFISQVDVKRVNTENITYSLVARGGVSAVEQAAGLGSLLRPNGDGQSFTYIQ